MSWMLVLGGYKTLQSGFSCCYNPEYKHQKVFMSCWKDIVSIENTNTNCTLKQQKVYYNKTLVNVDIIRLHNFSIYFDLIFQHQIHKHLLAHTVYFLSLYILFFMCTSTLMITPFCLCLYAWKCARFTVDDKMS